MAFAGAKSGALLEPRLCHGVNNLQLGQTAKALYEGSPQLSNGHHSLLTGPMNYSTLHNLGQEYFDTT